MGAAINNLSQCRALKSLKCKQKWVGCSHQWIITIQCTEELEMGAIINELSQCNALESLNANKSEMGASINEISQCKAPKSLKCKQKWLWCSHHYIIEMHWRALNANKSEMGAAINKIPQFKSLKGLKSGMSVFYRDILRKQYIASSRNIRKYRDIRGYHDIFTIFFYAWY